MKYIFNYPKEFTSLQDYTAHAGQKVDIVRPMRSYENYPDDGEYNFEGDPMFEIRAEDGWIGHAFESELIPCIDKN